MSPYVKDLVIKQNSAAVGVPGVTLHGKSIRWPEVTFAPKPIKNVNLYKRTTEVI